MKPTIVIHGGAGFWNDLSKDEDILYRTVMNHLLDYGYSLLKDNYDAIDIAVKVLSVMEDSALFNAGRGAIDNTEGNVEMDAGIADGISVDFGAVGCVKNIKNPIKLAKKIFDKSKKHKFLCGQGAEKFAIKHHIEIMPSTYFKYFRGTEPPQGDLVSSLSLLDPFFISRGDSLHEGGLPPILSKTGGFTPQGDTIGVVVLDSKGHIAAGSTTGGVRNKPPGRVGDTAIFGQGFYANDQYCGIACTGKGEGFMKNVVAYDIFAQMKYAGKSLDDAISHIMSLKDISGGIIAIDHQGHVCVQYTHGMLHGYISDFDKRQYKIFY